MGEVEALSAVRGWLVRWLGGVPGAAKVVVTDKEGVPLLQAAAPHADVSIAAALRPQLLTTHPTAITHTNRLRMGSQKSMVLEYDAYKIVLILLPPFTLTIIAEATANTGLLLQMREDFQPLLPSLQSLVADVLPS